MVSAHLKNIGQIGNLPQIGVKIKNIWNHHLVTPFFGYGGPKSLPKIQHRLGQKPPARLCDRSAMASYRELRELREVVSVQPIWKIWSSQIGGSFPKGSGWKFPKNIWVATCHHLVKGCQLLQKHPWHLISNESKKSSKNSWSPLFTQNHLKTKIVKCRKNSPWKPKNLCRSQRMR